MRRGEERATPHGETPYSPTSLLRALTTDPYSVDPLREDEHPLESATPPDNRRMRAVTLLLAVLLGFAVAVSVVDLRQEATGADSPRALLEEEVREVRALEAGGERGLVAEVPAQRQVAHPRVGRRREVAVDRDRDRRFERDGQLERRETTTRT